MFDVSEFMRPEVADYPYKPFKNGVDPFMDRVQIRTVKTENPALLTLGQ